MRDLRFVENEAVFKFTGIPSHHAIPEDHILADVTAIANLAILTDPRRAFHHRALFDDGIFTDEDSSAHEGFADESAVNTRLHAEF